MMIMENNDDDCGVGTPKWKGIKWFCDLIEKDIRLKKEKLKNLKKDQESTIKVQDEKNFILEEEILCGLTQKRKSQLKER